VGDMTLKQFFQVAGGALVALLFYASPLPSIVKWPFIVFFVLFGAALAFLPLEERPLEQWIAAFFKSVYSPTIFYWKKTTSAPIYFQAEVATPAQSTPQPKIEVTTEPAPHTSISRLNEAEEAFLVNIVSLTSEKPATSEPKAPLPSQSFPVKPPPKIPPTTPIAIPKTPIDTKPKAVSEEIKVTPVAQTLSPQPSLQGQAAQFSASANPPNPPTKPNTVVGQVFDTEGKIVEGAILEIKDASGRPARALKTNKAGHFWIATPLSKGNYELTVEKEGLVFEPLIFEANDAIIPPFFIKAKEKKVIDNA